MANVAARLDGDEKDIHIVDTLGGKQDLTIISESGLYSTILLSRKPEAKAFKRWITHEVLPAIRRDGGYIASTGEETTEELVLRAMTALQATVERQKSRINMLEPKAQFADAVGNSDGLILVREMAKLLKQNGYDTGEKRFYEQLRQDGFLISRRGSDYNMPSQYSMNHKLFHIVESAISTSHGDIIISKTPKVSGHGQQYFIRRYCGKENHAI